MDGFSNGLGAFSDNGTATTASNALAALSNSRTANNSSNALGTLAVAERDIRALGTARADTARSDD